MSFYRFGHLSRKQIIAIEQVLDKRLSIDVITILEHTNGGRFDCNCEHPIFVNDLNAEIQINVLYGLRKNKRENIYYWNYKYGHQIPENAVIIGDTWNHGFIVSNFDHKEKGIYYWDASYDFECSNEVANAYYIADSMGKMFEIANVDSWKDIDVKFLSVPERFSQWKKRICRYLSCRKKLRKYDADFIQQKRHKSNMFKKRKGTYEYNMKCESRKYIEEFGELVGYEFSEFFKKYAVDNECEETGKLYCLSENGLKVCFKGLLGLARDSWMSMRSANLTGYNMFEGFDELNKDFVAIAKSEENYIAINKRDNYIALLDSEGLFIDKIAGSFESFLASLCDEEIIKILEKQFEVAKKENRSGKEIIDIISELDDFFFLEQPKSMDVEKAQNDLGLNFAEDYKTYVSMAGAVCGGGIELTGVTHFDRLNVVKVTQREKRINPLIPDDMYVVETVGIDAMVVLQDSTGTIYTVQPYLAPKKLFNSLTEYIENVARFSPIEDAREGFYYEFCDEFGQDWVQRMENGLVPLLPSSETMHLHHMGLSQNIVTDISPIVEFKEDSYFDEKNLRVMFTGFNGENGYDRVACIRERQQYWTERSKTLNNS